MFYTLVSYSRCIKKRKETEDIKTALKLFLVNKKVPVSSIVHAVLYLVCMYDFECGLLLRGRAELHLS
jgi:hypothetical protein